MDPEDKEAFFHWVKHGFREVDEHLRQNNFPLEASVSIVHRFRGRPGGTAGNTSGSDASESSYELGNGVSVGHLVYLSGERLLKSDVTAKGRAPMGVCDEELGTVGGLRRGYCWFAAGEVWIATSDNSIDVGSFVYISGTAGVCTATPPGVDGSTVLYQMCVGRTIGRVVDSKVPVAFVPALPVQLGVV